MSSLGHYLEKHALFPAFIAVDPNPELFISIVIPCYNEPNIIQALDSIWNSKRPASAVEVIIVINSSVNSDIQVAAQNRDSYHTILSWLKDHNDSRLGFLTIVKNDLPVKDAGVGLARKIGMDEAVRRFQVLNRPEGIIVGFDADCTCSENYLCEIEKLFVNNLKINACSIAFEHPLAGTEYDEFIYKAVCQYELYLRYYVEALKQARHPFAFQTIGSAFAVRAEVYCKQGGMNKRKAGEDFYFLQKVIPLGNYAELYSAKVFPSPRTSDRVPFGTGAAIQKMRSASDNIYKTYDLKSFHDVSILIKNVENIFEWNKGRIEEFIEKLHQPLKSFLLENDFLNEIQEIKQNAKNIATFTNRFFRWFNAFKVLKYMNFSHESHYTLKPVTELATELLALNGVEVERNPEKLLMKLRDMKK